MRISKLGLTLGLTTLLAGCLQAGPRCPPRFDVRVRLPGATPEEVERVLVEPLEQAMKSAPELAQIQSTATAELALLTLEFEPRANEDAALIWIREAIERVQPVLPTDASHPLLTRARGTCE